MAVKTPFPIPIPNPSTVLSRPSLYRCRAAIVTIRASTPKLKSVSAKRSPRTVYSTDRGKVCPKCGWPEKSCRCSSKMEQAVPDKIIARLRIEKAGRKGKTVTVVESLPRNRAFLKDLAGELKRACGSGGKAGETQVEIQGDHREKIRDLLQTKGWVVKG